MLIEAIQSGRIPPVLLIAATCLAIAVDPADAQEANWEVGYGGQYNDEAYGACRVIGGGSAIAGTTYSDDQQDRDIYLLRLDSSGDTLWTAVYGTDSTDCGYDVQETFDGGFVISGSSRLTNGSPDAYVIRTDEFGTILWERTYGGTGSERGWSVRQTADSGFVVCGSSSSSGAGYDDFYLIRLNTNGDTLWTRTYGGPGGDLGFAVRQTPDHGFILAGTTGSFGEGYSSVYAVKTDSLGDTLWTDTYGGNRADAGYSVEVTLDGGLLFVGASSSFTVEYYDAYLVKTDANGMVQWEQTYGGSKDDRAYAADISPDGGYVLAGTTESFGAGRVDMYAVKVDPLGDTMWTATVGGFESDYCRDIVPAEPGSVTLAGYSYSFTTGGCDIYIVNLSADEQTSVLEPLDDGLIPSGFELSQNYPNPFNAATTITFSLQRSTTASLTIYNVLGQAVRRFALGSIPPGSFALSWDGRSDQGELVASGVYLYRLETPAFYETKKMVLTK